MYYIVNGITIYRMIVTPFLLILIINQQLEIFRWLLAVSFLTDAVDGNLARRYKVISVLGSKLDSIADDLTIVIAIIGMIVFKPEFLKQEITLFILLLVLFVLQTAFAIVKYGKISSFHTYAAKTAAILQGFFLLLLFFVAKPVYLLFYITVFITAIELMEEIFLVLLLPRWTTDVKGLYWVMRQKKGVSDDIGMV